MRRAPGVLQMKLLLVNSVICAGKGIFSKDPGSPVLTEHFLSAATSTKMSLLLSKYYAQA